MVAPVLLGIADRVQPRGTTDPGVPTDIIGLRQVLGSHLFPLDLQNFSLVMAFPPGASPRGRILFQMANRPSEHLWLDYALNVRDAYWAAVDHQVVIALPLRTESLQVPIWEPGRVRLLFQETEGETEGPLGSLGFVYVPAPPIPEDVRRGIESDPKRWRWIRLVLRCSKCGDGITPFTSFRRPEKPSSASDVPRLTWYEDLPDLFTCACGQFTIPLNYLKESMHVLLMSVNSLQPDGSLSTGSSEISLQEALRTVGAFRRLIDEDPPEEDVQTFIQQNPMMLAPFSARHLFFKPPVLTKYRADFGIVNSRNELLLIEIERPSLPILKGDGSQTYELTHAFSQTHCWHSEITDNRAAVLRCIDGCPSDITSVRYLLIAGRSRESERESLVRLLRSSTFCEFMTYDHLVEAVENAVRAAIT